MIKHLFIMGECVYFAKFNDRLVRVSYILSKLAPRWAGPVRRTPPNFCIAEEPKFVI